MDKNKSGYDVMFEFEFDGVKDDHYFYEIPFESFIAGVREYFNNNLITLDGTDNAIYNTLSDLGVLDDIAYEMKDYFEEHCRDDAYEEFKEEVREQKELDQEEEAWKKEWRDEVD